MDDRAAVARQIGREPRAFLRVVVRCPWGCPAVTEQAPYDEAGAPFPTTYWLTCPQLVASVSRLEAAGGVEHWSEAARSDPELAESLERGADEQRSVRRALASEGPWPDGGTSLELGIGGSSRGGSLKCLHAHVAYALTHPDYELGLRIVAELEPLWPADRCCSEPG
jgi:uncharacterized protein